MSWTESLLRRLLQPADPLDIPEWAAENFEIDKTSPVPGKYDLTVSPWLNEPLRDYGRSVVESSFWMAGLQTLKTTGGFICLSERLVNDPGPCLWYHNDKNQLDDLIKGRLLDSWTRSPKIACMLPPAHQRSTSAIHFPACSVNFNSSKSKANLTGRPARYVFGDEIKDWPQGSWGTVKKRISQWIGLGKTLGFSTPNETGDDVDEAFKEGHQAHLYVTCPHCARDQELLWQKNIEWDKHKTLEGEWDFKRLLPSIRIECAHCRAVLVRCADPAEEIMHRFTLLRSMKWVAHNPGAPDSIRSYTWSSLVNPRVPLRILVHEYLTAKHAAKMGIYQLLKDFYNQRLSIPWGEIDDEEGQLPNLVDYNPAEKWPDGDAHVITADYQTLGVVPAVCWHWSKKGEARYVEFKMLDGFAALAEMQQRLKVPPTNVFVDMRYHRQDVLTECQRYGWRAMMGEGNKTGYTWLKKSTVGEPPKFWTRPISPDDGRNLADPAIGTRQAGKGRKVRYFKFASDPISDVLSRLMFAKKITHPVDAPAEYVRQMNSERKIRLPNGKFTWQRIGKRANHARDCAKMQVVAAIYQRWLQFELEGEVAPRAEPSSAPAVEPQ